MVTSPYNILQASIVQARYLAALCGVPYKGYHKRSTFSEPLMKELYFVKEFVRSY